MVKGHFDCAKNIDIPGQAYLDKTGFLKMNSINIKKLLPGSMFIMTPEKAERLKVVLNKSWICVKKDQVHEVLQEYMLMGGNANKLYIHKCFWPTIMVSFDHAKLVDDSFMHLFYVEIGYTPQFLYQQHIRSMKNLLLTGKKLTQQELISNKITQMMSEKHIQELKDEHDLEENIGVVHNAEDSIKPWDNPIPITSNIVDLEHVS